MNILRSMMRKLGGNRDSVELLRGGSQAFVLRMTGMLVTYLFTWVVARWSGASAWGAFTIFFALSNLFAIIGKAGVDVALLRLLAEFKVHRFYASMRRAHRQALVLLLPGTIALSIITYYASPWLAEHLFHKPEQADFLRLASLAILPLAICYLNGQSFRGLKQIGWYAFFQFISRMGLALIFLAVLYILYGDHPQEIYFPIAAFIASLYIQALIGMWMVVIRLKKLDNTEGVEGRYLSHMEMLKLAFPMLLATGSFQLMELVDTFVIYAMCTPEELGIYNVALRIARIPIMATAAVNAIAAPKFSELFNSGKFDEFRKSVRSTTNMNFYSTLPFILGLFLLGKYIIGFFGTEFLAGWTALIILNTGRLITGSTGATVFILQMTGKERVYMNIILIALGLNLLLNILLIPRFGINGAAAATAVSMVFWNLACAFYVRKVYQITPIFNPRYWKSI